MRRWCLLLLCSSLLLSSGCGRDSYEKRLAATLVRLERERRILKNLMPAPDDKKYRDLSIYIRPPRDEEQTKTSSLPVGEGQFELDSSFVDKAGSSLYLLARVKLPKKAPVKGAPPAPPVTARGDFPADVLSILVGEYGQLEGLMTPKFVEESKRGNRFKRLVAVATDKDKEIKLYTYKQDNYDVALIFVYDNKLKGPISTKIDLCLETFATGPKAGRFYNGNASEESEASSSPVVPM